MITLFVETIAGTPRLVVQLHVSSCGRRVQRTTLTVAEARDLQRRLTHALEILCPSEPSPS